TGLTIRGMDLAAGSALAAASAAHRALTDKDYSDESMARYERNLERDFVGQDMRTYAHMPELLDSPRMYGAYGEMIADVMHGMFNMDTRPRTHAIKVATRAFKKSSVRLGELVRDGITALKAL
ncbi:FAD-dependent oxidoreductase, partial [Propionibacterium freudenreichii]|nr:FAD-dependent oxidoreductase [Propionibacterium freudenreichii]